MISFNFLIYNFKDCIFLSLFAWLASNLASSSLFLGLASVVLLFLNRIWKRPFAAMKYYYYHEYQTWDKLRIVKGCCDFCVSTNLYFILLNYILLSFLYCCKNHCVEILFIKCISTSSEIKQVIRFQRHCLLKFLLSTSSGRYSEPFSHLFWRNQYKSLILRLQIWGKLWL